MSRESGFRITPGALSLMWILLAFSSFFYGFAMGVQGYRSNIDKMKLEHQIEILEMQITEQGHPTE